MKNVPATLLEALWPLKMKIGTSRYQKPCALALRTARVIGVVVLIAPVAFTTAAGQNIAPQQTRPAAEMTAAQKTPVPAWQTAAGGKLSFDVASVKQNKTKDKASMNVDPTPGDYFTPTGGLYVARNVGLAEFVMFAYKLTLKQLATFEDEFPWSLDDHFDIEARADGNPTKDQYRLMMQSLLADRFKLAVHFETREVPVYALVFVTPGKLGPRLRLHRPDDPLCATNGTTPTAGHGTVDSDGFPASVCAALVRMDPSAPGLVKGGGRNVPMKLITGNMAGSGVVDRPVVDETGIQGNVDFTLERTAAILPGADANLDESGPTFEQALKQQLGLKLVPKKEPSEFFVVDHVEHPSAN